MYPFVCFEKDDMSYTYRKRVNDCLEKKLLLPALYKEILTDNNYTCTGMQVNEIDLHG